MVVAAEPDVLFAVFLWFWAALNVNRNSMYAFFFFSVTVIKSYDTLVKHLL